MESNGRVQIIRTVEQIIYDAIPQLQQNNAQQEPYPYQQYPRSQYTHHPSGQYGGFANQRNNFQNKFLPQTMPNSAQNRSQDPHSTSLQMEMIRQRMREQQQHPPINLSPFNVSLSTTISEPTVREEPNSTIKNSSANLDSLSLSSSSSSRNESLSFSHNSKRSITTSTPITNRSISIQKEALPRLSCIPASPNMQPNRFESISESPLSRKEHGDGSIRTVQSSKNNSTMRASRNASAIVNNTVLSNRSMKLRDETNTIKGIEESLQRSTRKFDSKNDLKKDEPSVKISDGSPENPQRTFVREEPKFVHKDTPALLRFKATNLSNGRKFRSTSLTFSPQNRRGSLRNMSAKMASLTSNKNRSRNDFQTCPISEFQQFNDSPLSPFNSPNVERNFDELLSQTRKNKTMLGKTLPATEKEVEHDENEKQTEATLLKRTEIIEELLEEEAEGEHEINEVPVESVRRSLRNASTRMFTGIDNISIASFAKSTAHIEDEEFAGPEQEDVKDQSVAQSLKENSFHEEMAFENVEEEPIAEVLEQIPEENEQILEQEEPILEQEKQILEQEEAIPEQEEQILEQEEAIPVQEEAIPVQEEAIPEQEEAIPEQEEAIPEQEEAFTEQEEPMAESEQFILEEENAPEEKVSIAEAKEQTIESKEQFAEQDNEVIAEAEKEPEVQSQHVRETPKQNKNVTAATTFCNISVQVTPNLYSNSHWNLDNDSRVFDSSESRDRITTGIVTEGFSELSIQQGEKVSSPRRSTRIQERSFSNSDSNSSDNQESSDGNNENPEPQADVQQMIVPQMDISFSQDDDENDKDSDKENRPPSDFIPGDSGDHIQNSDDDHDEEDENEPIVDEEQDILMSDDSQPENRMPYIEEIIEENNLGVEPIVSYPSSDDDNSRENDEFLYDETFHAFTKLNRSSFVVKRKSETPLTPPQEKRFKASPQKDESETRASLEPSPEKSRRMILGEIALPILAPMATSKSNDNDMNTSLKTNTTLDRSSEEDNINVASDSQEIDDIYGDSIEDILQAEMDKQADESVTGKKLVDYSESIIDTSKTSSKNITKSIRRSTKNPLVNYSSIRFDDSDENVREASFVENKLDGSNYAMPRTTIEVLGEVGEETFEQEFNPNATYVKSTIGQPMVFNDSEEDEQIQEEIKSMIRLSLSGSKKSIYSNRLVDYSICSSSDDDNNSCFDNDNDERLSCSDDEPSQPRRESIKKSTKTTKKAVRNRSFEDSAVSFSPSDEADFDVSNADAVIRPKKTLSPSVKGLRRSKRNRVPLCSSWFGERPIYRPEIDQYGNYVQSLVGVTTARVAPLSERRYVPRKQSNRKHKSRKSHHKHHSSKKSRRRVIVESDSDSFTEDSRSCTSSDECSSNENVERSHKKPKSQKKEKPVEVPQKRNMSQFLEMSIHAPREQLPPQEGSDETESSKHFLNFSANQWTETKCRGVFNCVQSKDNIGASGSMRFASFAKRTNYKCSSYSLQCWVSYGVFLVTVGTQSRVVKPGDFFKVPVGGGYSLENLRDDQGLINYQLLFSKVTC